MLGFHLLALTAIGCIVPDFVNGNAEPCLADSAGVFKSCRRLSSGWRAIVALRAWSFPFLLSLSLSLPPAEA